MLDHAVSCAALTEAGTYGRLGGVVVVVFRLAQVFFILVTANHAVSFPVL